MRVQMILPDDLVARVDVVAGSRGRTAFVVRALESALSTGPGAAREILDGGSVAAPSRAPVRGLSDALRRQLALNKAKGL